MIRHTGNRIAAVAIIMAFSVFWAKASNAGMKLIEPSRRLALIVGDNANKKSLLQLSKELVKNFGYELPRELYGDKATQAAIRREIDVLVRDAGPSDSLTVIVALPGVSLNRDDPFGQFLQTAGGNVKEPWTLIPVVEIGKFIAGAARASSSLLVMPQCPSPAMSLAGSCAQRPRDRVTTTVGICANAPAGDPAMASFIEAVAGTLKGFAGESGDAPARGITIGELLASSEAGSLSQISQCPVWAPPFTFTVSRNRLASTLAALDREAVPETRVKAVETLVEIVRTEPPRRADATHAEVADRLAAVLFDTSEAPALRGRAARGLGELGNLKPAVIEGLAVIVASASENVFVRTSTIDALAMLGTPVAAKTLRDSLARPTTSTVAGDVIVALGRLMDSESLPLIVKSAATGDERSRRAALEALPAFGGTGNKELSAYSSEINAALLSSLQDPSASVRQAALVLAGSTGCFGAASGVKKLMAADPEIKVREAAIHALGRCIERREIADSERADAVRRLLEASFDTVERIEAAALWSLGRAGGDEAVSRLIDVVKGQNAPLSARVAAIEALGVMRSERAVPEVSAILAGSENDARLREVAAAALGAIGAPAVADILMQTVAAATTDLRVRSAAQRALERFKTGPAVLDRLKHPDAGIRLETVRMLGDERSPEFASNLIVSLNDPAAEVREAAVVALSRVAHDPGVVQLLTATLATGNEMLCREGAARVLGSSPAPEAGSSLVAGIEDKSPDVRAAVTESLLRQLGAAGPTTGVPPEVRAALLRAAGDSSAIVRRTSAIALGWLQDSDSAKRLQELTKDTSLDVRKAAFDALARRTRLDKTAY